MTQFCQWRPIQPTTRRLGLDLSWLCLRTNPVLCMPPAPSHLALQGFISLPMSQVRVRRLYLLMCCLGAPSATPLVTPIAPDSGMSVSKQVAITCGSVVGAVLLVILGVYSVRRWNANRWAKVAQSPTARMTAWGLSPILPSPLDDSRRSVASGALNKKGQALTRTYSQETSRTRMRESPELFVLQDFEINDTNDTILMA